MVCAFCWMIFKFFGVYRRDYKYYQEFAETEAIRVWRKCENEGKLLTIKENKKTLSISRERNWYESVHAYREILGVTVIVTVTNATSFFSFRKKIKIWNRIWTDEWVMKKEMKSRKLNWKIIQHTKNVLDNIVNYYSQKFTFNQESMTN